MNGYPAWLAPPLPDFGEAVVRMHLDAEERERLELAKAEAEARFLKDLERKAKGQEAMKAAGSKGGKRAAP